MKTDSEYYSFLLRIWKPNCEKDHNWRLSLEDPHNHHVKTYLDLESLYHDLIVLMEPDRGIKKPPQ